MKYWIIVLEYDGEVTWGVHKSFYIAGIYTSEAEAFNALRYDRMTELENLAKEHAQMKIIDDGGYVTASIVEFDPDSTSEKTNILCIGGAWYVE